MAPFSAVSQSGCPAVSLPIIENFNTTDSLPQCWERWENFDEPAMKAHIVSSPVSEGIGALMISCGSTQSTVHRTVVRARTLSQSPSGIRLRLKMRASQMGTGEVAVIVVGVCSSASENYMTNFEFDTVQVIGITTSNVWSTYDIDFGAYSGTGDRLAFLMSQPMQTGTAHKIYLDEMTVERCAVSDLWVSHRASDELTLHWSSFGQGTANLTVTPSGGGSALTFDSVTSPFRITGLDASTTYVLTLTPQCAGEALAGQSQSMNGTTLEGPHLGLMYCEGFESSAMPAGWTTGGGAGTTTTPHYSGSRAIQLGSNGSKAVLPIIALSGGTAVPVGDLMLNAMMMAGGSGAMLEIGTTDYPEEDSEITPFDTLMGSELPTGSWGETAFSMSGYSGTDRYIVLRNIGSVSIDIDDLKVGRCLLTGVALTGYTSTTATVEWDVPQWVGNVAIASATGNTVVTVTPSDCTTENGKRRYTLTGLTAGEYYSYTVYGLCDDPCNAATVSFNTFNQEYTLPYCTEFEATGTLPTDWTAAATYNNTPRIDNTQHHSGTKSLMMSAAGSVAGGNYSMALLPPLDDTAGVTVSFAAYSDYSGGTIEVGTVDGGGSASSFVASGQLTVATGQWQRYAVSVTYGATRRIALRYSHNSSGNRPAWIDDLEVSRCGVSGVSSYDERANGATIAWTATCDSVDIQYRKRGTANTQTVTGAESPLVLNDLDQGSTYDYYLRCTEDGVQGCWIYGGYFVTNAGALTADYCHNGTVTLSASATLWNLPYLEESNYSGLIVSFEVSGSGTMQVGLMTTEGVASTFIALGSTINVTSTPTRHSVTLTGHEAQGHYIALKRVSGSQTVQHLRLSRGSIATYNVSNVTATTALVSWTTEGTVDSVSVVWQGGGASGEVRVGGVTSVTLTGLTAGTSYTYTLTAINDLSAQSCAVDEGTFITLSADITDGWCENFNSVSTGSLPNGWTAVTGQPTVSYYSGSNRLVLSSTASSSATVALPMSVEDFSQTPLVLRVEALSTSSSPEQSSLVAGIMTDANDASTFTALGTIHPSGTAQTYLFDLSSYGGTGRFIALRYVSPSQSRTVYIDNLALAADIVAAPTVSEVTDHSVRICWQGASTAQIHWSGGDTTATGNCCTIDGLANGTTYTFTIVADGVLSVIACQQLTFNARTLDEPTTAPLCTSFESIDGASGLPYGWTRVGSSSYPTYTTGTTYDGSRSLMFYTTTGNSTTGVSPMFEETTLNGQYVSFYAYGNGAGSTLQVGTMSDPGDASTFVMCGQCSVASGQWSRYEVQLTGAPATHRYIALRHTTSSGNRYVYVDKLMVQGCPMPTAMSIEYPQSTSMEVRWSGGTVTIEWYRSGYSSGHQTVTATGGSHLITGLTPNTDYTVELWALCDSGDDFSCHRLSRTQHTLPLPSGLPYCQSFNSYTFPSNWFTHTVNGSVSSTSYGNSGRAIQLNLGSNATDFTSVTMPQLDTAGICADISNLRLEMMLMRSGTGLLQIGTMQNLNDSSDFIPFHTINLEDIATNEWTRMAIDVPVSAIASGFVTLRLMHNSGSTATAWVRIDELCIRHCNVGQVTISDLTPTSATFTWDQGGGAEGLWVYWSGGSYYSTTSPFTITDLNPNETYNFTYAAQCDCDVTVNSGSDGGGVPGGGSVRMPASPMVTLPKCYNFDDYSNNAFPAEWRRSGSSYPRVSSSVSYSGSRSMDFYASSGGTVTLATQPLPVDATHAVVSLRVYCSNADAANGARLLIGTMSDPEDFSTFSQASAVTIEALDTWQDCFVEINNPVDRHIALRFAPSSGSYHLYVDDFGVTDCAVTALSAEGGVLSISSIGTPAGYLLTVINEDDGSTRNVTLSAPPLPSAITFSPDSNYHFDITATCQSSQSCIPISATYGYRFSLPYCEEFDGTGLHPYGWMILNRNSATYPRQRVTGSDSTYYQLQATTAGCLVALPLLPLGRTLGGLHVWLQVKLGSTADIGNTTVELGSVDNDGVFTTLATLQNSTLVQSHNITLPANSGTRLAIRARCTSDVRNVYIDHLQVTDYARPDALHYTRTSNHLQHIYWDNTADNSYYTAEWGPAGFTVGTGTMTTSDSCHLLLTPTTASTSYDLYLYDTAGTRFCTPYHFTTLPASASLTYCLSGSRTISAGSMLYLPEIDVPVGSTTLLVNWRTYAGGSMIVGVLTEYQSPSTFTPVDTLYPAAANTWELSVIDLYDYTDTGRFVAIRFEGATGYINQLSLQTVPQPVFHVLNSSSIEATLPDGYPADYYLRVVPQGQSQSSATALHVDSTHYVITGLAPYTYYNIYVTDDASVTTCAPPVTLRTHLDIGVPYCTTLASQPDGWNYDGRYRVMPYVLIDSIDSLHLYFTSRGDITLGLLSALDDTASFIPVTTFSSSSYAEQTVHMNQYTLAPSHHYLAFRYESSNASITTLTVLKVARPTFHVLSSSSIEVTMPDGQTGDYWLEICPQETAQGNGTVVHVTTSPYVIDNLSMYSYYNIYLLDGADASTCEPPTLLRTHLDITAPYCESYTSESDGWYVMGETRTMPRLIIDTMGDVYVTFTSRGTVYLGVQPTLYDTSAFVSLWTVQSSVFEEHVVHLQDYASAVGDQHYISFHGGELQTVYLHTCPLPTAVLTAFNAVTFTQQESGIDYWIRCSAEGHNDSLVHSTDSVYTVTGLAENTYYSFHYQCDSATAGCIPPVTILTGVRITTPHCVQLGGISMASVNTGATTADGGGALPAGWRAYVGSGGERYFVMPILDIDSSDRLFARFSYRIAQTGSALSLGVMTDAVDPTTFSAVTNLSNASGSFGTHTLEIPLGGVDLTIANGLYIAFRASGNAPAQVYLDSVALQRVPFAEYLHTSATTVEVRPYGGGSYPRASYIACLFGSQQTIVRADTLPWQINGLAPDATYQFSIQADSLVASCYPATPLATTHVAETPLCDLTATLSASEVLWRGPELEEPDLGDLRLRFTATCNRISLRVVVGTLRWRNVDSTFHPIDTITLTSTTAHVYQTSFQSLANMPAYQGRFLAFKLLPVASTDNATLSDISIDHCLTATTAHLTLVRHNIVRLECAQSESIEWIEYGPTGFTPGSGTTVHITSLPIELTLSNSTTYDIYLLCDSGSVSCAPPLNITTMPTPPPLGWCEPFDSQPLGSLPSNWRSPTVMTTAQEAKVDNSRSHTSPQSLYMNATIGHSVVAILPDLGLDSLNGLAVSLWLNSSNPTTSRLEVGVIFNTSDPESFYPLHTLSVESANSWQRHLVDLRDAPSGAWFVALRCEGSTGLNRLWVDDLHIAECGANSFSVVQVEAQQVTLRWRQVGSPTVSVTVIPSEGQAWTVTDAGATSSQGWRQLTVTGLEALTNYRFAFSAVCDQTTSYCTTNYLDTVRVFTPAGGVGCIDPTNLAAAYTSCFYGSYNNPYANIGTIDYGYASAQSRHTIHYDLDEHDPRTGNNLSTVPEGSMASVRLGNWTSNSTSPEAESLVYGLNVDTMDFDLLIMRYAAVLQDPDHAAADQPRFSLELLDSNMQVIDPVCARADFIANWQMGWNFAANSVLWKDWTTVGLDMTPYSGQTVYIRLTTRDCNEGSHYGYAYFTLECMRKNITTTECGVVSENNLTAPAGFNYSWYTSADTTVFSHQQTITVPSNNYVTYLCDNAFVDNPTCVFTMSAFAGIRYPLSLMEYSVSLAPCSFDVHFYNHSTISSDGVTPVGTGEGVETARWYFGTGDSATTYNTYYNYPVPGTYNVQLISGIAGDNCLDTLTVPLTLAFPPTGMAISGLEERCLNAAADTLTLPAVVDFVSGSNGWTVADSMVVGTHTLYTYQMIVDSASFAAGTHTVSATVTDSVGCTLTLTHTFTVHPTYLFNDSYHICTLLLPYSWRDTAFAEGSTTGLYTIHRYSQYGCDSIMRIDLNVYDNSTYTMRDTMIADICDNQSYWFSDSLLTPDPTVTHNVSATTIYYTDSLYSWIGCDSLSTIVLTVHPTYEHHLYDTLCSNQSYIWGFPQRSMYTPWSTEVTHAAADTLLSEAVAPTDTSFTDILESAHQCDSLSSLHLHLLSAYHLFYIDEMCDGAWVADSGQWAVNGYRFEDSVFYATVTHDFPHSTMEHGCDSLRTLTLTVWPTHDLHILDTIYDGDTYTFEGNVYDTTGVYPNLLATGHSCDSLRTLHLTRNRRTYIDTVICQNSLPLTWHHTRMSDTLAGYIPDAVDVLFCEGQGERGAGWQVMKDSVHLFGRDDIDSLVVMTLIVRDTSSTFDVVHSCDSLVWMHTPDTTYRESTYEPARRLTQIALFDTTGVGSLLPPAKFAPFTFHLSPFNVQCDSVRHLTLTVDYTHFHVDQLLDCDSLQWRDRLWYYRDTLTQVGAVGSHHVIGPVDTLLTVGGCDSVVSLDLAIRHATYEEAIDTFCWYVPYTWRGQMVGDTTTSAFWPVADAHNHYYLTDTLQTHVFYHPRNYAVNRTCDSVMAIRLTQMAKPDLIFADTIDCANERYNLHIATNVPYTRYEWAGGGHENGLTDTFPTRADHWLSVYPDEPYTTYTAYVDYHRTPLCPVTAKTSLRPVVVPEAEFRYSPKAIRYNDMDFDAYDLTPIRPRSIHPHEVDIWRRYWYTDDIMLRDTTYHLTHDIVLAELPPDERDTVRLTLEVYNGQCRDTVTHMLALLRVAIFAPNVFTPTEQTNNRFVIVTQGVTEADLRIYNREGLLIYQSNDLNVGWDGRTSDGRLCEQGNYVWKLIYRTIDHPEATRDDVGTVLLIR